MDSYTFADFFDLVSKQLTNFLYGKPSSVLEEEVERALDLYGSSKDSNARVKPAKEPKHIRWIKPPYQTHSKL